MFIIETAHQATCHAPIGNGVEHVHSDWRWSKIDHDAMSGQQNNKCDDLPKAKTWVT